MPILTAAFMAVLFKWGQVADAMTGAKWAIVVALASAVPTILYGWVYGGLNTNMTMIDCAQKFVTLLNSSLPSLKISVPPLMMLTLP